MSTSHHTRVDIATPIHISALPVYSGCRIREYIPVTFSDGARSARVSRDDVPSGAKATVAQRSRMPIIAIRTDPQRTTALPWLDNARSSRADSGIASRIAGIKAIGTTE